MRTLWWKSILIACFSLLAVTSTYAAWQCRTHNAKGQVWFGTAPTRAAAAAYAMQFCARGSTYARNCVLDYCRGYGGGVVMTPPGGTWQCNATNARGQLWIGRGPTRAAAAAFAMKFCAANSAYARNCVIRGCFVK